MEERDYLYLKKGILLKERYAVDNIIGERSNFSMVYKGEDRINNKKIIIKEFFPKNMALRDMDKKSVVVRNSSFEKHFQEESRRFLFEGELMKKTSGRYSAECYDCFEENGTGYIIMKYHRGENLEEYIKKNGNDYWEEFIESIIFPFMDAIDRIHSCGYLHRDIKPGNIIIDKKREPIVIDFGSAHRIKCEQEKRIMVTPGFSPIEFYSGRSRQDESSDVYSIAAMLYYYFCKITPPEAVTRVVEDSIEEVSRYNSEIPFSIEKLVLKNLSMNREHRDRNVKEFKKNLKRALQTEKVLKKYRNWRKK